MRWKRTCIDCGIKTGRYKNGHVLAFGGPRGWEFWGDRASKRGFVCLKCMKFERITRGREDSRFCLDCIDTYSGETKPGANPE